MNIYEARNHGKKEILVAATTQSRARFAEALRSGAAYRRWSLADRVELVVLGEGLDPSSARAFVRAYCPLRASAGWRVTRFVGRAARSAK